jgi:hypothetical protein
METKTFLKSVLGDEGFYCVFAYRPKDNRRIQKFYSSIDAVVDTATQLDADGFDVYFALATFEDGNSRKVNNVKQLKSLFLDLDCGPSKDFATQKDAINALRAFCKEYSLPRPTMINSGRGVHVYWPLTETVGYANWFPVAERLKLACAEKGFMADPAVTSDAARVLRVPKTHNFKTEPPAEVCPFGVEPITPVDFDQFAEKIGGFVIPVPTKIIPESYANAVTQALLGNKTNSFKQIIAKTKAGTGCQQIKIIATNQLNVSEPLWRAGLSIATNCEERTKAIHAISKNHPEYSALDTEKKADALIDKPYRCATFDELNPDVCTSCVHWGKIKSPITLGGTVKEASEEDNTVTLPSATLPNAKEVTYTIPRYPTPYFRGENGGVYQRTDEDAVLIYHNDLYVVKRIRDSDKGEAVVMRLHLPKDGVREFTVPLTVATSKEELRKAMSAQGVAVVDMGKLMQYVTTWVNQLQAESVAEEARNQFGWVDEECSAFVLGNQIIYKDRIEFNPPSTQTVGLFPAFVPKGTLGGWKETMNWYNREGFELHQFVIGTAFGSVLMELSPVMGAGLNIYGDTGIGKTTAMFAGLSLWGDPDALMLIEKDTINARMNRADVYKDLPLYVDELTNPTGLQMSDFVYQLTQGRQKIRMGNGTNQERTQGKAGSKIAVLSANCSIVEKITMAKAMPKAEAQRLMEVYVKKMKLGTAPKSETDDLAVRIKQNFGQAGVIYVQYIMNHFEDVKKLLKMVQERVDEQAGLSAENRFWSALVSTTLTGLILAKRAGLLEYDTKPIFSWAIKELKQNKLRVEDMSLTVTETLNEYIHEHWGNVLWIKSTDDLRKQHGNGLDDLVVPEMLPRGKLVARYETDVKKAYIVPKPFKDWCIKQQLNYQEILKEFKEKLNAKIAKVRLSKGTHLNLPPTSVIVIDCILEHGDVDAQESIED